jgi:hypothetical protein
MPHVAFLAVLLVAGALGASGCATCDPEQPKVDPRVGGEIGTGTGGSWSALGVGFDVTNLFCRTPKEPPAAEQPLETPTLEPEAPAKSPADAAPPAEDAEP